MLPGSVSCGKSPALLTRDRPGPLRPTKFSPTGKEARETLSFGSDSCPFSEGEASVASGGLCSSTIP